MTDKLVEEKAQNKSRNKKTSFSVLLSSIPKIRSWKENVIRKGSTDHDKISSFFIAFYDTNDQYHRESAQLVKKLHSYAPEIVTSDYIFDETATYLLLTHGFYGFLRAKKFDKDVLDSKKFNFVFINDFIFQNARKMFKKYNKDKKWSFTDCTSFALMEDYNFSEVLTFDRNFAQKGFKSLP